MAPDNVGGGGEHHEEGSRVDKRQADGANCPTGHDDENDEVFHIPDTFENVMKSVGEGQAARPAPRAATGGVPGGVPASREPRGRPPVM